MSKKAKKTVATKATKSKAVAALKQTAPAPAAVVGQVARPKGITITPKSVKQQGKTSTQDWLAAHNVQAAINVVQTVSAKKKAVAAAPASETKAPAFKRDVDVHEEYEIVPGLEKETYDGYFEDLIAAEQADGRGYVYFAGLRLDLRDSKVKRDDMPGRPNRNRFTIKDVPLKGRKVDLVIYDGAAV